MESVINPGTPIDALRQFLIITELSLSPAAIKNRMASFSFLGFDPSRTYAIMLKAAKNPITLEQDVETLICFGLERGTNIDKAVKKMDDSGIRDIKALQSKYSIKDGKPESRDTITMGRIMATFTLTICKIIVALDKCFVAKPNPAESLHYSDLPLLLCFPSAAAMIPRTWKNMFDKWCLWSEDFSSLYKTKTKDKHTYRHVVWNSSLFTDTQRESLLGHLFGYYEDLEPLETDGLALLAEAKKDNKKGAKSEGKGGGSTDELVAKLVAALKSETSQDESS
jgi:hypothetical protein